jgi:hypothetical protein
MRGESVVLDATFLRRDLRKAAARLARETGAQFACVEVSASEGEVRKRLARRTASGRGVSDAGWEIYVRQKRKYQRPTEVAGAVVGGGSGGGVAGVVKGLRGFRRCRCGNSISDRAEASICDAPVHETTRWASPLGPMT